MKIHETILNLIDKMTANQANREDIKKACYEAVIKNFPTDEYLTQTTFSNLFEYNPDGLYISLLRKDHSVKIKKEGYRKLYRGEDSKRAYIMCAMNIPLYLLSKFLAKKGYVENAMTFYMRFRQEYFNRYDCFRVSKDFFGDKAMSVRTVSDLFYQLRMEKYIKENWYTTAGLAQAKGVSDRTICQWITNGQITETYKFNSNRVYYISPQDSMRIIVSESIGYLAERRKIKKNIDKLIKTNRDHYVLEFSKLRNHSFREMSWQKQSNVSVAAKAEVKGSVEYLLKHFDKNACSIAGQWKSHEKTCSFDELYQIARIGLLTAINRYAYHKGIVPYIHKTMKFEVQNFVFSLWGEKKKVREFYREVHVRNNKE